MLLNRKFLYKYLISLNSVGVTLPTLILFVKDGVGERAPAPVGGGTSVKMYANGNAIFDGTENDKRIKEDAPPR